MRQTVSLRSFTDRPGYGENCAVCPFCGKINDSARLRPGAIIWCGGRRTNMSRKQ